MRNLVSLSFLPLTLLGLAGCGGSSDAVVGGSTGITSVAATYVLACRRYDGDVNKHSQNGTLVITPASGASAATVSARFREYGDTACTESTLVNDYEGKADVRELVQTKTYKKAGVDVAANVVELQLNSFTLHKAVITGSLPTAGVTRKMAYVLDGDKLYVTIGHLGADGLGDALSTDYALKQAGG